MTAVIDDSIVLDAEYSEDRWKLKNRVIYVGAGGEILADVSEGSGDLPVVVHDPYLTDPEEAQRRANIRLALNKEYGRSLRVTMHQKDFKDLGIDLGDTCIIQLPSIGVYDLLDIGVTCDNVIDEFYVNGVDYSSYLQNRYNWMEPDFFDVKKAGKIVIAIACHNVGTDNPAGLLMRVKDKLGNMLFNGSSNLSKVKAYFSTSRIPPSPDWYKPDYDDSSWSSATSIAQYGSGPWGSRVSGWDDPDAWWFWANGEGFPDTPNSQYVWFRIVVENGIKFALLGIEYDPRSLRYRLEFGGRKELLEDWLDEQIGGDVARRFGQVMTLPEETSTLTYSLEAIARIQGESRYVKCWDKPPLTLYNAENVQLNDHGWAELISGATEGSFEAKILPPSEMFISFMDVTWGLDKGDGDVTIKILRADDSIIKIISGDDVDKGEYWFERLPKKEGGWFEGASSNWGKSNGDVSDVTLGILHPQNLKLTPDTLGSDMEAWYPSGKDAGWDLSWAKFMRLYLYGDHPTAEDFSIKIRLYTDADNYYEGQITVRHGTWKKYEVLISSLSQVGSPDLSNINWISILTPYELLIDGDYVFLPLTRELVRVKFELSRPSADADSPKIKWVKIGWREGT